jgi:hypothetical protein
MENRTKSRLYVVSRLMQKDGRKGRVGHDICVFAKGAVEVCRHEAGKRCGVREEK